jgi:Fe-S cluster assembly protein SufD
MTTTVTTKQKDVILDSGVFTQAASKAISIQGAEPNWLAEKRRTAWKIFEDTPMPTTSDEPWRRTSLQKVRWNQYSLDVKPSLDKADKLADLPKSLRQLFSEDRPSAGRLLIINGEVLYHEIDSAVAAQGVIYTDLQTAAQDHTALVQPHLMEKAVPASDSKFAAMNAALWKNGCFLYVPKNVALEHPFHTIVMLDGEGASSFHRTLIVTETYGKVDYIEETASMNDNQAGLNVGVVEIIAQEGAQVRYGIKEH